MIYWSNENGEGSFQSKFFQDDEYKHKLSIYINDDKLKECAEKCVESLNNLTDGMIDEICTQLWENVKDEFTLPKINDVREILNYCWFEALYVDLINDDDEIAYAVEGEGDWGTEVGFVIRDNKVIYAGIDYLDYIKNV